MSRPELADVFVLPASSEGASLSGFESGFDLETAAALDGPAWLRDDRAAALEAFQRLEMPTEALEEWRYSRIGELSLKTFTPATSLPNLEPEELADVSAIVAAVGGATAVIETHNGHLLRPAASSRPALEVRDLSSSEAPPGRPDPLAEPDPFVLLNRAFAPTPLVIRAGGKRIDSSDPVPTVVLVHRASGSGQASFPRVRVELAELAELSVIEVVCGGPASLVVPVTELCVEAGARLAYTQVQMLDTGGWQIAFQASRVDRDGSLVSAAVALGGDYARLRTDSALVGPGASGRLLAFYFGSGNQMHDFRTVQHHRSPKTESDLLYKGVVANTARSVYSGLIRVDKGARGTNAMQTNRNLVLHDGAHADSVPNLEIEDNDVRCTHASAVGPIAEDQRFYLESRGVPPHVADRLIALGFLDDVLEQLPTQALAAPLRASLARKLAAAESVEQRRRQMEGVVVGGAGRR